MLMQALTMAASVGLGCGTCCGSSASAFLAGYILTEAGGYRSSLRHVLSFLLGKLLSVTALCLTASLLGNALLDDAGMLLGIDLHHLTGWVMLACSVWLILRWVRERRGCGSCTHCHDGRSTMLPSFGVGLAYGASPCAPLVMVLGYAALLPFPSAMLLGVAFALCSSLTPMLVTFLLTGALSAKLSSQLGKLLSWFRLALYAAFLVLAIVEIWN